MYNVYNQRAGAPLPPLQTEKNKTGSTFLFSKCLPWVILMDFILTLGWGNCTF